MTLRGGSAAVVRSALEDAEPLPGTTGFAGAVDGFLVRDVLGRQPLFFQRGEPERWSYDPRDLDRPTRLPAGAVHDGTGIEHRFALPEPEPAGGDTVARLRATLASRFDEIEPSSLAVGFSGGVDSTLVAATLEAPLYTVGFRESHDIEAAKSAARMLDRELRVVELDPATLERLLGRVVRATGRTNAMDVAIAVPLSALAERVHADGFDRLALGQGADELFGGYAKVAAAPEDPRVEAATISGARREMIETLPAQLERDVLVCREAGVEAVVPLLGDRVIETALELPGKKLVTDRGERKWALRLAAREWIPDRIAFREKKALQYGSLVARELDRLAREDGFKRRMDDHVSRYIEAVVEESVPVVDDP